MKYLFDHWIDVEKSLKEKPFFFFLDYDGTLSRIREEPGSAVLSARMKGALQALVDAGEDVAVVTGRRLDEIKELVGIKGITYVGSHGLDVHGPGISFHKSLPASYRKVLDEIRERLEDSTRGIAGVIVEDKGNVLTLHFRKVREELQKKVEILFHEATALHRIREKIRVTAGKKVLEVRPAFVWDKGKIVLWLLARYRFLGKESGVPLYIGDDTTDEDAFSALCGKGFTVFVGRRGHSCARYFVNDTADVYRFLRRASLRKREE